ncbi:MAG TPA: PIN domain-containing protein [Urbifossiella sp.]|jgi:predicted nucleic acid-binding protein|nr:PIN domain-containing protein [Urbifossiella sp.]
MTRGRPHRAVFDTPLLVAYRDADQVVIEFLAEWVDGERPIILSAVSALEVIARSPDPDDRRVRLAFIKEAVILPLTAREARVAHKLVLTVPVPTRLTSDDALVAATAVIHKLPLYSTDPGRYATVPGLTTLPAR